MVWLLMIACGPVEDTGQQREAEVSAVEWGEATVSCEDWGRVDAGDPWLIQAVACGANGGRCDMLAPTLDADGLWYVLCEDGDRVSWRWIMR